MLPETRRAPTIRVRERFHRNRIGTACSRKRAVLLRFANNVTFHESYRHGVLPKTQRAATIRQNGSIFAHMGGWINGASECTPKNSGAPECHYCAGNGQNVPEEASSNAPKHQNAGQRIRFLRRKTQQIEVK